MQELLGRVVRLQVQVGPLKPGTGPGRRYDPAPLRQVVRLLVGPDGAVGVTGDGARLLDVHNRTHPQSRDRRGRAGLSFLSLADYRALRRRFGAHLADGTAGESLLLETAGPLAGREFPGGLVVESSAGPPVPLAAVRVAAPCVEFTRFCLRRAPGELDRQVRTALTQLGGGARGYRAVAASGGVIGVGARVWAPALPAPRRGAAGQLAGSAERG